MSESEEPRNPFQFMLDDLLRAIGSANLDPEVVRRQFMGVAFGVAAANEMPSVAERIRIEDLFDLATRQVASCGLLPEHAARPFRVVTAAELGERLLGDLSPYLDLLAQALSGQVEGGAPSPGELAITSELDLARLTASLSATVGPMFANGQIGSVLGHYALSALSRCDLAMPVGDSGELLVVGRNLVSAAESVHASLEEVALYWLMREQVIAWVLSQPVIADRLDTELRLYLLDLKADTSRMVQGLAEGVLHDPSFLVNFDPTSVLESSSSPAQEANLADLMGTMAVVVAVHELVMAEVGPRVLGGAPWIERLKERLDSEPARVMLASVFGLRPAEIRARAERFAAGVSSEHAAELVAALGDPERFPSAAEVDDPGLWLLRLRMSS